MIGVPYFLVVALVITGISAWIDWRTGEIPNHFTLIPLCAAPLAHLVMPLTRGGTFEQALESVGSSVLGAAVCALVPMVLYRAGAIGGGDVKLLAALGALLRPMAGIEAEFYAFLAAAIIAPARLAYEGKLTRVLRNTLTVAVNPFLPKHRRRDVPPEMMTSLRFGPSIFLGTCAVALIRWRSH